jgi:aspartokinase-like uncharacterized kinase
MQVIKLGGSLSESTALRDCLHVIAQYPQSGNVIVPGGGDFAEQVRIAQRVWQFNDSIAHEMAILAMQQMALLFKSLQNSFVIVSSIAEIQNYNTDTPIIWSPNIHELNQAGIRASWEITSDSLAIWLAKSIVAQRLIIVKMADIVTQDFQELTQQGIVDAAFCEMLESVNCEIQIMNVNAFLAQYPFAHDLQDSLMNRI